MIAPDDILDTTIGLNVADTDQVITSTANVQEDLIRAYPVNNSRYMGISMKDIYVGKPLESHTDLN